MKTSPRYSTLQIALHWIIMVLILFNFLAHDGIEAAWEAATTATPLAAGDALFANLHVIVGSAMLALALLRLALRLRLGAPAAPPGPRAQQLAGHLVHWGIYLLLFALPISGMAAWFGGVGPAAAAHEVMKSLLLILVALHIAAALYHQFVMKDNLLARMRPGG